MSFYTKYSLNNHDKKKHGAFSTKSTSGGKSKPTRIKKSTIIVMPGPPDRQVREDSVSINGHFNDTFAVFFLFSE